MGVEGILRMNLEEVYYMVPTNLKRTRIDFFPCGVPSADIGAVWSLFQCFLQYNSYTAVSDYTSQHVPNLSSSIDPGTTMHRCVHMLSVLAP